MYQRATPSPTRLRARQPTASLLGLSDTGGYVMRWTSFLARRSSTAGELVAKDARISELEAQISSLRNRIAHSALSGIATKYRESFPETIEERCAGNRGLRMIGREAEFPLVCASNGAAVDARLVLAEARDLARRGNDSP